MMTRLITKSKCQELIEQEVTRFGPMGFAQFVSLALYHPTYGYYNQKRPQRGRLGDYFTSYQVSDLFPEIFASVFIDMKKTLDCDQFTLIEIGAGDGELIEKVLTQFKKREEYKGLRVFVVERSRPARERIWKVLSRFPKCEVVSSLDDIDIVGGVEGCIFSNELFDAFPFNRFKKNGDQLTEIKVDIKNGELIESNQAADGHEIELRQGIEDFYESAQNIFTRGYILTVDYGYPRADLQMPERKEGSWVCYHRHQANKEILKRIGQQDITAHVDFTELREVGEINEFKPMHYSKQGIFLTHVGEKEIQQFLTDGKSDAEKRKRVGAVQQLLHPDAMGGLFKVFVQSRNAPVPPLLAKVPNRLRHLED